MNVKDCPQCGRESVVKDSRVNKRTGAVKRRRVCSNPGCGRRWHTVEVLASAVPYALTSYEREIMRRGVATLSRLLNKMDEGSDP
jgi:transcriptional regulator NrdR family protein